MRDLQDGFERYDRNHQDATNRLIQWLCLPLMLWSVIAALWVIPVPPSIGRPGFWCGMTMVGAFAFYWRRSRPIGLSMLLVFVLLGIVTELLYRAVGPTTLLQSAVALFVLAWIGRYIGCRMEGAPPSFLINPVCLLVGPAWLVAKILRRINIAY